VEGDVLERTATEGDSPIPSYFLVNVFFIESICLGVHIQIGGKLLLKLNTGTRPIANK